jgi:hypothetical protein
LHFLSKLDVLALLSLACPEIISVCSHDFPISLGNFNASKLASELTADFADSFDNGPSVGPLWLEGLELLVV